MRVVSNDRPSYLSLEVAERYFYHISIQNVSPGSFLSLGAAGLDFLTYNKYKYAYIYIYILYMCICTCICYANMYTTSSKFIFIFYIFIVV